MRLPGSEYYEYVRYIHSRTAAPLHPGEVLQFCAWLLDREAIATRGSYRLPKHDNRMVGKYICRSPDNMRNDDFRERLYVAFAALRQSGSSKTDSSRTLTEVPSVIRRLQLSKPLHRRPDTYKVAETIRSLVTKFNAPLKDTLLERWVGTYRLHQIHEDEIALHKELTKSTISEP